MQQGAAPQPLRDVVPFAAPGLAVSEQTVRYPTNDPLWQMLQQAICGAEKSRLRRQADGLVAPLVVDGAMTLFTLANVTNAAREGARAGSIYQTSASGTVGTIDAERNTYARSEARRMLGPLVDFSACDARITSYSPVTPALGNPYREMDSFTFRLACPRKLFFGLVGTGVVTLTSEATMRIEPGGVAP